MEKYSNLKKSTLIVEKKTHKIEETKTKEIVKSEPSKFISKIFESREMAHVYQLKENDSNKALESYYEKILELVSKFLEIYEGQYQILENYEIIDTNPTKDKDKIEYFKELAQFIKDTRYKAILEEDTHLHKIIDEMSELVYRTLYKLKYTR